MHRSLSFLGLLTGVLLIGSPAFAQTNNCPVKSDGKTVEAIGNGEIDYGRCVIRVAGNGAPPAHMGKGAGAMAQARLMAERAAKMDAFRNILEVAKGVRVQGESTADELAFQNPSVRSKVQGRIRAFKIVNTRYFSDASVQITVEVPLAAVTGPLITDAGTVAVNTTGKIVYTGLVIDARGTGFKPAALVKVTDEKGSVLYSPQHVAVDVLMKAGVNATYAKTAKLAGAPLVLKAKSTGGGALVLAADAADKLRQPGINYSFLRSAQVVVVID
jgi:hypothetical protein